MFCTSDLAIFRWNALYEPTLGTSFAIFPSSMGIDTAYTYSVEPSPGVFFGFFSKLLFVFEKNICENRVLRHRLGHFSVKYPIWVNLRNMVCHLPGFYGHRYCFYVLYIDLSPMASPDFFWNFYWFSREKKIVKIVFCTIHLAIFRSNALFVFELVFHHQSTRRPFKPYRARP